MRPSPAHSTLTAGTGGRVRSPSARTIAALRDRAVSATYSTAPTTGPTSEDRSAPSSARATGPTSTLVLTHSSAAAVPTIMAVAPAGFTPRQYQNGLPGVSSCRSSPL